MRTIFVFITLTILALSTVSCGRDSGGGGGGGGTPAGKAYGKITWTSDIVAANFTEVGLPNPFNNYTTYLLITGNHNVYWTSNSTGTNKNYGLNVDVYGGTPGYDRVYTVKLSGNTLYFSDALVAYAQALESDIIEGPDMELRANP